MKTVIKIMVVIAAFLSICGCASYETTLRPPDAVNPVFMRYQKLAPNKVFVIAVDPDGTWAFGYDHSRKTLEEAAENATLKCDKAREKFKVHSQAKLFAVNDDIVYYDNISNRGQETMGPDDSEE